MHYFLTLLVLLTTFLSTNARAEAPLGDWLTTGQNPGETRTYKGNVSVIPSGDTYTVMWRFGATTYIGTGIDMGAYFAVTFMKTGSQEVGLVLLHKQGQTWQGLWTPMGGQIIGKENWIKANSPQTGETVPK